ncbi:XRE family transcriptional regulator [Deferrisoma camini]|uniref:XRE family transcriptional regulator n=1 Tax=Deferrisoma camini TaxID=1035120 RepID=UPI00146C4B5E|nr:S24 family peptidase [Deferrisoma camini]
MATIGEQLRAVRKKMGMSQSEFARLVGVSLPTIQRYERGETSPKAELLRRVAKVCDVSFDLEDYIIEPEGKSEGVVSSDTYTPIPLVKPKLAGGGGSVVIDEGVETWLHFRTEWLKQIGPARQLVLMRVEGDSMEPTLYENDVIMIHQGKRELRPGKLYAIGIDDRLLVKRLHPALGGGIEIISDNPRYGKEVIKEGAPGFRVIGQAVWMARKLA